MKYVYIMKAGTDYYKVGTAKHLDKRIATIQTGNAHKVYLVACRLCNEAEKVETMIHSRLIDMTAEGGTEWFKLTPEEVLKVCILLNMQSEVDVYNQATLNTRFSEQNNLLKNLDKKIDTINKGVLDLQAITVSSSKASNRASVSVNNTFEIPQVKIPDETIKLKEEQENNMYNLAIETVTAYGKASCSLLQRELSIGYGRAARIIDQLERDGIIGTFDGSRARRILKNSRRVYRSQQLPEISGTEIKAPR